MRTLPLPNRDQVRDHLVSALKVRERDGRRTGYAVSEAELDTLVTLYDEYDAARGAPGSDLQGPDLDEALKRALRDAYDLTQAGRRLGAIRETLFDGVERCPICGISAPRTLDHHLPKSTYQPLAIYVRNLVPLCGECNQHKSSTAPEDVAQQFPHPYFELLPDGRFLRAVVSFADGGLVAEFGLEPAVEFPNGVAERLTHVFGFLKLNARYAREINNYLCSHTTALHMCFNASGGIGVRRFLRLQAGVEEVQLHLNHWRPVLLTALGDHDGFCAGGFLTALPVPPGPVLAPVG